MDNKKVIRFVFDLVSYTIPEDTNVSLILLPNGKVLGFNGFLETSPPQLRELHFLDFSIQIRPGANLDDVAEQLNAVLATELGYCPDHPNEHGPFCRECGKMIISPVILPVKPPFPFNANNLP